jgi:hypothetical protein
MTTYIKVMSFQNLPDSDPNKDFKMLTLADGDDFAFITKDLYRAGCSAKETTLQVKRAGSDEWENVEMTGNVYVMNAAGKTIASRSPTIPLTIGKQSFVDNTAYHEEHRDDDGRGVAAKLTGMKKQFIMVALADAASQNPVVLEAAREFVNVHVGR